MINYYVDILNTHVIYHILYEGVLTMILVLYGNYLPHFTDVAVVTGSSLTHCHKMCNSILRC